MNNSHPGFLSRTLACLMILQLPCLLLAADSPGQKPAGQLSNSPEDRANCRHQLEAISKAITAYRQKNKDIPNWLSDLVPEFLQDTNVLICPVALRTGAGNPSRLTMDPKFPTTYSYQFCPASMGPVWQGEEISMRTYQRKLMGQIGSEVPIVRCLLHDKVQNLSFAGKLYDSAQNWEMNFTSVVRPLSLTPERLAARESAEFSGPAQTVPDTKTLVAAVKEMNTRRQPLELKIPPRDPAAKPGMIDLTPYYNAVLTETWHPGNTVSLDRRNDLSNLPRGLQSFSGVEFDVRGLIQLLGRSARGWGGVFPEEVKGIKVGKAAKGLNFLHGTGYEGTDGTIIGYYIVNYASGPERKIPIVYGKDVRDWWYRETEPKTVDRSKVAWTGTNEAAVKAGYSLRIYSSTWKNPQPDTIIETIDFVSTMADPAPFLIAITAE